MLRRIKNRRGFSLCVSFCLTILLLSFSLALAAAGHEGVDRSGDLLDLLYRFMNFALLVIILFLVFKKVRIKDFFRSRSEEIQKKLDELKGGKEEAEKKFHEIEKKLKEFESNKQSILDQFRSDGLAEKERILAEAKERAQQIIEQAGLTMQQEMKGAKNRLQKEIVALATQRAQAIIAREMTDKDQARLVDEFIEKVRKVH